MKCTKCEKPATVIIENIQYCSRCGKIAQDMNEKALMAAKVERQKNMLSKKP